MEGVYKQKAWYNKQKVEILRHYSPELKCSRCGFSDIRALSIDHINGGGCKHRKEIKNRGGWDFYNWLVKNNYPDGYQVLCMNCQFIKKIEDKEQSRVISNSVVVSLL